MKFIWILKRGYLDMVSVPILVVWGGAWLSSDCL
jgi:hypothetical protein